MGTINIYDRLEYGEGGHSVVVGNLSRPYTVTTTSNIHQTRTYSLPADGTITKIYDASLEIANPVMIRIEWSDAPIDISWGDVTNEGDNSSFRSDLTTGPSFLYFFGSQMHPEAASAQVRNAKSGLTEEAIDLIYASSDNGAIITVRVDIFK